MLIVGVRKALFADDMVPLTDSAGNLNKLAFEFGKLFTRRKIEDEGGRREEVRGRVIPKRERKQLSATEWRGSLRQGVN